MSIVLVLALVQILLFWLGGFSTSMSDGGGVGATVGCISSTLRGVRTESGPKIGEESQVAERIKRKKREKV